MIDLTADLTAWLGTPEVRALLKSIVMDAVHDELRTFVQPWRTSCSTSRERHRWGCRWVRCARRSSAGRFRANGSGIASGSVAWICSPPAHALATLQTSMPRRRRGMLGCQRLAFEGSLRPR
jgi:hypothetical protein